MGTSNSASASAFGCVRRLRRRTPVKYYDFSRLTCSPAGTPSLRHSVLAEGKGRTDTHFSFLVQLQPADRSVNSKSTSTVMAHITTARIPYDLRYQAHPGTEAAQNEDNVQDIVAGTLSSHAVLGRDLGSNYCKECCGAFSGVIQYLPCFKVIEGRV